MEGEGEPAELRHLKRDLATVADDFATTGEWLAAAVTFSVNGRFRARPDRQSASVLEPAGTVSNSRSRARE